MAVLSLFPYTLGAQDRTVTGTVLDAETGEPIPFASVAVKGTTSLGTYTLDDGTFTLEGVPSDATTLIASFVGYQTLEVTITNGNMVISLEPDALFLDQVVVTALGIQRQAKADQRRIGFPRRRRPYQSARQPLLPGRQLASARC